MAKLNDKQVAFLKERIQHIRHLKVFSDRVFEELVEQINALGATRSNKSSKDNQ